MILAVSTSKFEEEICWMGTDEILCELCRGRPPTTLLDEHGIYFLINHDHFHLYDSLFAIQNLSFLIYYCMFSTLKTCIHTHTYKHIQYIQTHQYETVSSMHKL